MLGNAPAIFSISTPTYNRAHLLGRVYESLQRQTFPSLEWVVIDDGSTDDTASLVRRWQSEAPFPIRYYYQQNLGVSVAINRAIEVAQGRFFAIIDSDDWLAPNCLENAMNLWDSIDAAQQSEYAGVCGLCASPRGDIIGTPFPCSVIDTDFVEMRTRYRVRGDKFNIIRTEVMRDFRFPDYGVRLVPEALLWNRIAQRYKVRCANQVLAYKDYQSDGITANYLRWRVQSSAAFREYYRELAEFAGDAVRTRHRMRAYRDYIRFSLHSGISLRSQCREVRRPLLWGLCVPLGFAAYIEDRMRLR